MRILWRLGLFGAMVAVSGCATVTGGTRQAITLSSNVEGAECSILRNGVELVAAAPVPATHQISKRRGNLVVVCEAEGYRPEQLALVAGKHPMAALSALAAAPLYLGTDALSHAWHSYQDRAYVHLTKATAP